MADKALQKRIGQRLRAARKERGLSFAGMCRLGFDTGHCQKLEIGAYDMRVSTLIRLANALGVEPGDILNGL